MKAKSVDVLLSEYAELYKKKNADYGDSYKKFGKLMYILFPNGYTAKDINDWNMLGVLNIMIHKIVRISSLLENPDSDHNFESLADSAADLSVYASMLDELSKTKQE